MPRLLLIEDDGERTLVMEHALIDGGYRGRYRRNVTMVRNCSRATSTTSSWPTPGLPDGSGIELAIRRGI